MCGGDVLKSWPVRLLRCTTVTDETQKTVTLALAILGALSGVVGTCLGILNTWRQFDRDKVKLVLNWTVEPWGGRLGKAVMVHSLKVENLSPFAITIAEVGLVFAKPSGPKIAFSQTTTTEGETSTKRLPIRLDSHDNLTVTGGGDGNTSDSAFQEFGIRYLYLRTGDGFVKKLPYSSINRA